ncbi:MAG: hypothetical protein EA378_07615 [Phycisphaerales bacterium]|nr:MAG: hypothetical protein EA378_07615 [Phycisphaerales bacterium]
MTEPPSGDERLMRIEESEAFNARQLELLHEAILELGGKMDRIAARMRQLEAKLAAQEADDEAAGEEQT